MNVERPIDDSNAWTSSYMSCDECFGDLTNSGTILLSSPPGGLTLSGGITNFCEIRTQMTDYGEGI